MDNYQMKILIVDDERSNLEVLCRLLKTEGSSLGGAYAEPIHTNHKLYIAKSGQTALKLVAEEKPDLILLDIMMPGMSGFETLVALKNSEETCNIPVIFITGLDSVEDEEKGFTLGAVDYITKPFNASLVRARVRTHLRIVEQMRMIEQLGLMDSRTGIPNRRGFENQITTEWARAIREKEPISLLMIDIDHFKSYNDVYGHQQGDTVLVEVARTIKATLKRPTDFAARWGGEEFAVVMPNTGIEGACKIAEDIRAAVEASSVMNIRGELSLNVTVSVGAASTTPVIEDLIQDFVDQADKALYAAKESGRNRVSCYKAKGARS